MRPKSRCQKDRRSLISISVTPSFGFSLVVSLILPAEAPRIFKKGYSPYCLEGVFSGVHIQDPAQLRFYEARIGSLPSPVAKTTHHMLALNRHAPRDIEGERHVVGGDAALL